MHLHAAQILLGFGLGHCDWKQNSPEKVRESGHIAAGRMRLEGKHEPTQSKSGGHKHRRVIRAAATAAGREKSEIVRGLNRSEAMQPSHTQQQRVFMHFAGLYPRQTPGSRRF